MSVRTGARENCFVATRRRRPADVFAPMARAAKVAFFLAVSRLATVHD
jgi:hypothetical protein